MVHRGALTSYLVDFVDTQNWQMTYSMSYVFLIVLSLGVTLHFTEFRPRSFRRSEGDVLAWL